MSAIVEPTRHKLSIEEYERLFAAGVLPPDSRVELIEGDLIDMPSIGTGHASVSVRLNRLLVRRAGDDAIDGVAGEAGRQALSIVTGRIGADAFQPIVALQRGVGQGAISEPWDATTRQRPPSWTKTSVNRSWANALVPR